MPSRTQSATIRINRESDRERLLTALRGGTPDCVPYLDVQVSGHVVDAVLGHSGSASSPFLPAADYVEFCRRVGMDAVYIIFQWGLGRVYRETSAGEAQYVDGSIKSSAQLADVGPPDLSDTLRRLEDVGDAARRAGLGVILAAITPYKVVKAAVGYQDFLIKTSDDPRFLTDFRDKVSAYLHDAMVRLLEYPVDVVWIPGDLCFNAGPMLSPDFIRAYWVQNTNAFIRPAREKGIPVCLHMDGDFSPILDIMLEVDIQAIHPFEVTGKLDVYRVKEQLAGRAAVAGNIDCAGVLLRGTPVDVRRDVREHIERLAPGGGYVCGSSHEITPNTPVENFVAMVEAVDEFGAYAL